LLFFWDQRASAAQAVWRFSGCTYSALKDQSASVGEDSTYWATKHKRTYWSLLNVTVAL